MTHTNYQIGLNYIYCLITLLIVLGVMIIILSWLSGYSISFSLINGFKVFKG